MTANNYHGLILTIGCPGSGKSTWADSVLNDRWLRLERDRFRECLFGDRQAYHTHSMRREIKSHIVTQTMHEALMHWPTYNWAVTDTNLLRPSCQPFIKEALLRDLPIRLAIFDRSEEYLKRINAKRPEEHRVPDEILEDMIRSFEDPDNWWRNCDFEKISVTTKDDQ